MTKLNVPAMGSAPGDNTKMRGVQHPESANEPARSKVGGSIKARPMISTIKSCTAGIALSGLMQRRMTILSRPDSVSHLSGNLKIINNLS